MAFLPLKTSNLTLEEIQTRYESQQVNSNFLIVLLRRQTLMPEGLAAISLGHHAIKIQYYEHNAGGEHDITFLLLVITYQAVSPYEPRTPSPITPNHKLVQVHHLRMDHARAFQLYIMKKITLVPTARQGRKNHICTST